MKLGGGMGRSVFCGAVLSVLAAAPLAACGDEGGTGGGAGDDGSGGSGANGGGTGGGGSENPIASCDDRSTDGTKVSGTIDSDTTWSGRVYLESSVTVSGATLTIEPGTVVIAAADSELSVSAGGAIVSGGTEDDPIAFCGESSEAGLWAGISIADDAAASSELSYTLVSNAGSGDAALVLDSATLVDHVAVTDSGADGVHASVFAEDSTDLTVAGAEGAPAVLTHAAAVSPFPTGGELTGNGDDHVVLDFASADVDMTFAQLSVPYLQPEDLDITAGATTFEAGVVYQLGELVDLVVGTGAETVLFHVNGTEDAPVYLEGAEATPGYFRQILLGENVDTESAIEHAVIRYGGPEMGVLSAMALNVDAAILVVDLLVEQVVLGVAVVGDGLVPGSSGLVIRDVSLGAPLNVSPNAAGTVPADTDLHSNEDPGVVVNAGILSVDATLPALGVEYLLGLTYNEYENLEIAASGSLTIPAGIEVIIPNEGQILVSGSLVIEGTDGSPVSVSSGSAVEPIMVMDGAQESKFHFVDFGGSVCLTLYQPTAVTDSDFANCTTGIRASNAYPSGDYTALLSNNVNGTPVYFTP